MVIFFYEKEITMNELVSLKKKSDELLIYNLTVLVKKEREMLIQILHLLKEIELRRLYLARGYPSLFAMLTQEMGYSESAAGRRIQAMRLLKDLPEVEEKISSGKLSLSVASQVQGFIGQMNKKRKLERAPQLSPKEKQTLIKSLAGTSARECEKKLLKLNPEAAWPKEKTKALSPDKALIQFLVDSGLLKKIQKLKELTSHSNPQGTYELLFQQLVELGLERWDPQKREERRQKRKLKKNNKKQAQLPTLGVEKNKRPIPIKLRDQIYLRDRGQCQFRNLKTGKICGSKSFLQIDHRYPFSLGGGNQIKNLRLRCRNHNQYHAREVFVGNPHHKSKSLIHTGEKGIPKNPFFPHCG